MICKACKASGAACTHLLGMSPEWKPYENTAKVDAVMACNPALRDSETRGIIVSSNRYWLSERQVHAFRDRARYSFPLGHPDVLYTGIDPSGGGSGSKYAIVTITRKEGRIIVRCCCACNDTGRRAAWP